MLGSSDTSARTLTEGALEACESTTTPDTMTAAATTASLSLKDASPDELYRFIVWIQTKGKETESEITARHESIRRLRLTTEQMRKQISEEDERRAYVTAGTSHTLQLADLAARVEKAAVLTRDQAQRDARTATDALWTWLDALPSLTRSADLCRTSADMDTPDVAAALGTTEGHEAGAAGETHANPLSAVQRAQSRVESVLASLDALATAASTPTAAATRTANGSPDDSTTASPAVPEARASGSVRKSISFADDASLVVVVPVPGYNAARHRQCTHPPRDAPRAETAQNTEAASPISPPAPLRRRVEVARERALTTTSRGVTSRTNAPTHPAAVATAHTEVLGLGAAILLTTPRRSEANRRRTVWRLTHTPKDG